MLRLFLIIRLIVIRVKTPSHPVSLLPRKTLSGGGLTLPVVILITFGWKSVKSRRVRRLIKFWRLLKITSRWLFRVKKSVPTVRRKPELKPSPSLRFVSVSLLMVPTRWLSVKLFSGRVVIIMILLLSFMINRVTLVSNHWWWSFGVPLLVTRRVRGR